MMHRLCLTLCAKRSGGKGMYGWAGLCWPGACVTERAPHLQGGQHEWLCCLVVHLLLRAVLVVHMVKGEPAGRAERCAAGVFWAGVEGMS